MRLLFDQNIAFRISSRIITLFPNSNQVRNLGIENSTDMQIWQFAKVNNYTIITFDADFYDLSNLKGHPPKIIWIRTGNANTNYLAKLIIDKKDIISKFINNSEYKEIASLEILNHE